MVDGVTVDIIVDNEAVVEYPTGALVEVGTLVATLKIENRLWLINLRF